MCLQISVVEVYGQEYRDLLEGYVPLARSQDAPVSASAGPLTGVKGSRPVSSSQKAGHLTGVKGARPAAGGGRTQAPHAAKPAPGKENASRTLTHATQGTTQSTTQGTSQAPLGREVTLDSLEQGLALISHVVHKR